MQLIPLKSRLIKSSENLIEVLKNALKQKKEKLKDGDILIIASKVVSYCESRLVFVKTDKDFKKLIKKEADKVLQKGKMVITLKNHVLIPNAGIDNSNTPKGYVVLWPKDAFKTAHDIRQNLMREYKLKNLGILINDSHCQPLRLGTSGIAIGWAGFEGVEDVRGKKDLFGKKMRYTQIALADNVASSANLLMGETNASIPFVIVRDLKVKWSDKKFSEKDYFISPKKCIYRSFYNKKLLNL